MGKTRRRPAAPDAEGGDRESTHFQQAQQVADLLKRIPARFDADRKRWYHRLMDSGVWREDALGMIEGEALWQAGKFDPKDKGALASYFLRYASVQLDVATRANDWDRAPECLGTPAACINMDSYLTGQTSAVGIDRDGNVDSDRLISRMTRERPRLHAPRWEAFLLEACGGDAEMVAFLQRWAGYALSGHTSEHCVLFVYGPAGTGKSRFVDALQHAWGDYAATLPMDALMASRGDRHPAELAMLKGVRLAVAVETEEGRRWDASKIKNLTGGDRIAARFMRENWFFFDPTHKLCVVGNHAPQLAVVDDAMRRRLLVVPFTRKPATPDPRLPEALRGEAGGILHWAIRGYQQWREHGLQPPKSIIDATEQYFDDEDSVGAWLKEEAVWEAGKFVSGADLYRSWSAWCVSNGQQPKGVKRLLEDLLRRPGLQRHRQNSARGVLGLRLLNSAPQSFGGWANEDRNRGDDGDAGVTL